MGVKDHAKAWFATTAARLSHTIEGQPGTILPKCQVGHRLQKIINREREREERED